MAATSNFQSPPQMFVPRAAVTPYSSQLSVDTFFPTKYRRLTGFKYKIILLKSLCGNANEEVYNHHVCFKMLLILFLRTLSKISPQ